MSGELTGVQPPALPSFVEVEVAGPSAPAMTLPQPTCGQIGIELPSGIRLTVDTAVDADALTRVLGVLRR
jgi:transposase